MNGLRVSLLLFSVPFLGSAEQAESWEFYKQEFFEHQSPYAASYDVDHQAKEALLQMSKLGDKNAVPFLEEICSGPQEIRGGLYARYPDDDFKHSNSYRGIAQVGLAMLGDEDRRSELIEESFHPDYVVRHNALKKVALIPGEAALESLSNFLGDTEVEGDVMIINEWLAISELMKRFDELPFPVIEPSGPPQAGQHFYYTVGDREGWLRWRFENYGPIPGREELFAQFVQESKGISSDTSSSEGSGKLTAGKPGSRQTPVEIGGNVKWWLWSVAGIAALVAIVFAALKKSA